MPRVKADYAIVLDACVGKECIASVLPQLEYELRVELEEMLRRGEQPLFAGHVVFYEDPKALLNAYRALLGAPEKRIEEVALRIRA